MYNQDLFLPAHLPHRRCRGEVAKPRAVCSLNRSGGHASLRSVPGIDTADDAGYPAFCMTTGAWFSLTDAAALGNKSRVTLRRYLDAGRFPNARQDESDPSRQWLIPLADLQAVGVEIHVDTASDTAETDATRMILVRLAVAEALAEERAAEIVRLAKVVEALTAQVAVLAAVVEGRR